ncbi:MAG: hypothetical protein RR139_07525 [Lachnospiraceae bacterium]
MNDSSLLSITLQSHGDDSQLLNYIHTSVSCTMKNHHMNHMAQDIYSVNKETKKTAQKLNISPAHYLAIKALQ